MSVVVSSSNTNYAMTDSVVEEVGGVESGSFQFQGHRGGITSVAFNQDGSSFATGSEDGNVFVWSYNQNTIVNEVVLGYHRGQLSHVEYSYDNSCLLSCDRSLHGYIYDLEQEQIMKTMLFKEDPTCIASNKRGDSIAVTSEDGLCYLFDTRQKAPIGTLETKYPLLAVCMTEVGDRVYTAGVDETMRCWDLRKQNISFLDHTCKGTITGLTLSADESIVTTNSTDNAVRTFDVRPTVTTAKRHLGVYGGAKHDASQSLLRVAISKDGEHIAAGSADGSVCVWNTDSYELKQYPAHQSAVLDTKFHPTQNVVLTGAMDGTGMILKLE